MNIKREELIRLGAKGENADKYLEYINEICDRFQINTQARVCNFLAQIFHESAMLSKVQEGLSYSVERLMEVWPAKYPTRASALPYARSPQAYAEKQYGGRFGNRPGTSDALDFAGKGLIQLTFKDNYSQFARFSGVDVVAQPHKLLEPRLATLVAGWYWDSRKCNPMADLDSLEGVRLTTKAIQGGEGNLKDRQELWKEAKVIFADKTFSTSSIVRDEPVQIAVPPIQEVQKQNFSWLSFVELILSLFKKKN